jgi:protein O-GlcNAc transferase
MSLWQQAQDTWEKGQLSATRETLEVLLQQDPHHAQAQALLGELAWHQRRWKEACQHLEKACEQDPDHARHFSLLAQVYRHRQMPEQARRCYAHYLERHTVEPDLMIAYASLLGELGEIEAAQAQLEKCLCHFPDHVESWLLLGNLEADKGNTEAALRSYQEVIARQPQWPEVYRRRGQVLLAAERMTEAREAFEQALTLDHNDAESWNNLGALRMRQAQTSADYGEAIRCCLQGLAREPRNPYILVNAGLGFFGQGQYHTALFYFEQARVLTPDLKIADFETALSLLHTGQTEAARPYLEACLENGTESRLNLAEVHTWLSQFCAQEDQQTRALYHRQMAECLRSEPPAAS